MKPVKLCTALATALLLAAPMVSFAQEAEAPAAAEEEESPISWSLAATTDYVFRGVSQTNEDPAFQAGITYTTPFGLYVGVWGSNVDFGDPDPEAGIRGPNFEVDGYVGYSTDLNDSWNVDVSVVRYAYFGETSGQDSVDYNEFIGKLTWSGPVEISGLVAYAPDYGNLSPKAKESYANLAASYDIGETGFSVGASVGYTSVNYGDEIIEGDRVDYGVSDYFDGAVTVSKGFGPGTLSVGYYDTFGSDADELKDAGDIYDSRVAVTFTIAN
ncbi:MAG TPA: TorF family putative porin [Pseudoxanthomonas sp.]